MPPDIASLIEKHQISKVDWTVQSVALMLTRKLGRTIGRDEVRKMLKR